MGYGAISRGSNPAPAICQSDISVTRSIRSGRVCMPVAQQVDASQLKACRGNVKPLYKDNGKIATYRTLETAAAMCRFRILPGMQTLVQYDAWES